MPYRFCCGFDMLRGGCLEYWKHIIRYSFSLSSIQNLGIMFLCSRKALKTLLSGCSLWNRTLTVTLSLSPSDFLSGCKTTSFLVSGLCFSDNADNGKCISNACMISFCKVGSLFHFRNAL